MLCAPGLVLGLLIAETDAGAEERSTGLPSWGEWTFNFDAGFGAFGFNNSLYANQRPDPSGDLSDNWLESFMKPALSGDFKVQSGTVFAKVSGVGERTFSAPPTLVGDDASSFQVEDLYIGWRSGDTPSADQDVVEVSFGRAPYKIGHGFLLWDGAGDGGTRGGFWSGARKAWEYAGIGTFKTPRNTADVFYLDRDELPESDTGSSLWGLNYEFAIDDDSVLGVSYLNTHSSTKPLRKGMDVYDARAFVSPKALPGLSLELEYAYEENQEALSANGWTAQVGYELTQAPWSPRLSYRYAFFSGDDPGTAKSEAFDPLFPGFYDWGTWWQGEIGGEYFLSNSNLISSQLRLHLKPTDAVSGGVMALDFKADHPASLGPGVTAKDVLFEIDGYVDWKLNDNLTTSFVLAYAEPDDAVEQAFGRTESLSYGMVYLSYTY